MTNLSASSTPTLKEAIIKSVNEYWKTHQSALLLSSLGQKLNRLGFKLDKELAGRKLADFISKEIVDELIIIQSKVHQPWIAAIPKIEYSDNDTETYFQPSAIKEAKPEKIPKFSPVVWAAFTKKIPDLSIRVIEITPDSKIKFQDLEAKPTLSPSEYKIEASYVCDIEYTTINYKQCVFEKIKAWSTQNQIAIEKLFFESNLPTTDDHVNSHKSQSLLEKILMELTEDQRQRTHFPLDVVAHLIKR